MGMVTYLPYPNYRLSAHVLDPRILGQQRADCMEILWRLAGRGSIGGRRHFAAVSMWRGFETSLACYADCVTREWDARGYPAEVPSPRTAEGASWWGIPEDWATGTPTTPDWLGIERLHASHRATLLRRDRAWYAQMCWDDAAVVEYFWPQTIPTAGSRVMHQETGLWLVIERVEEGLICMQRGQYVLAPLREIRERVWRRVLVDE